ncbi:hypothetical protein VTN31DRAFT_6425 [Thermomyces dupontii]|uniref:uncharacterized protein n=1 Tax=Talaromyces thermophilus TaxID=28565 RepID=UPI003742EF50
MVHEMCLRVLQRKLYLAPVKKPQRVIDLATGTGLWAIDFADQHPEAEVKYSIPSEAIPDGQNVETGSVCSR